MPTTTAQSTPLTAKLRELAAARPVFRVAAQIGIHPAALAHHINGRRRPDAATLGKILTAYPTLELEILTELRLRAKEEPNA